MGDDRTTEKHAQAQPASRYFVVDGVKHSRLTIGPDDDGMVTVEPPVLLAQARAEMRDKLKPLVRQLASQAAEERKS
jgi:hypothetical protein